MQDRNNDVVLGEALRRQAGRQGIEVAEGAGDDGRPGLQANAEKLRDADLGAGLEPVQDRLQRGPDRAADVEASGGHGISLLFGVPRMRAMRPVRASSRMPLGRIRSMKASILLSWPETSIIMVS